MDELEITEENYDIYLEYYNKLRETNEMKDFINIKKNYKSYIKLLLAGVTVFTVTKLLSLPIETAYIVESLIVLTEYTRIRNEYMNEPHNIMKDKYPDIVESNVYELESKIKKFKLKNIQMNNINKINTEYNKYYNNENEKNKIKVKKK